MLTNKYPFLDDNVINFINKTITNREDFNEERFQLWIDNNEIQSKNNPSAFVNKCFLKELNKGTFIKPEEPEIEYVPATTPMFNYMRELGIKVTQRSTGDIDVACTYILKHKVLTPDELATLNRQIIKHINEHKDTMNSGDFLPLMKKAKVLAGKVNWTEVDDEAQKLWDEWEELMKELDALEAKEDN